MSGSKFPPLPIGERGYHTGDMANASASGEHRGRTGASMSRSVHDQLVNAILRLRACPALNMDDLDQEDHFAMDQSRRALAAAGEDVFRQDFRETDDRETGL